MFNGGIIAMTNFRSKLHQEIHVTVRRFLFACARTEDPKLFGFVPPCDSVYFISLRTYFIKHAHINIHP